MPLEKARKHIVIKARLWNMDAAAATEKTSLGNLSILASICKEAAAARPDLMALSGTMARLRSFALFRQATAGVPLYDTLIG